MLRATLATLFSLCLAVPALLAQAPSRADFRTNFEQAVTAADQKLMDTWLKKEGCQLHATLYFEELCIEKMSGTPKNDAKIEAMKASWQRSFAKSQTLDKLQRWCDGMTSETYAQLQKSRNNSYKLWEFANGVTTPTHDEVVKFMQQFAELARVAEGLGHNGEAADIWNLACFIGNKMPGKSLADRKEVLFATEQFLAHRKTWEFTQDAIYVKSSEFARAEKAKIEEEEKVGDKRKAEGYDPNAKGVDSLVMVGAVDDKHALTYEALTTWETDLDYGPKNGPVPALWWNLGVQKEGTSAKFNWFRQKDLFLVRTGATKYAVTIDVTDVKKGVEVDVGNKGKPSTFFLDADKKVPYSMFFWSGSEREKVGEAEPNLMPTTDSASIYFRSAASWKTTVGAETVTFYDDNANGQPCDSDVFEPPFKVPTLGDHAGEGTVVPLLDSMRFGKGPRVPYSEFVKFGGGWFHMHRTKPGEIGLRPLNPDYFKTGRVKLVWATPKGSPPAAPVQLVLQGVGDYRTAFVDVAGGKEVELPAGNWNVIFGRIVLGKGARTQMATIYQGQSQQFTVEPGKVFDLKMGAPFAIQWTRRGDENATIDALQIMLKEASGCVLTELHGMGLAPEVFSAKAEDGKGAKPAGKFLHFTDTELLNAAARKHGNLSLNCALYPMPEGYRDGELMLKVKLAAAGMKLQLAMKKHALFGPLTSPWQ